MRLFIGIEIPSELKEEIFKIQKDLKKLNIKLVEKENFHICLKFLGEVNESLVQEIYSVLENITLSKNAFEVSLKGVGVFPNISNPRVVWVGVESDEILNLAEEIDFNLSKLGFEKEKRKFVPHLTLGRLRDKKGKQIIKEFLDKYKNLKMKFYVDKITLFKSKLSPKGPTYKKIKEFHLVKN